jgi:3-oxoacyl-[acyl-carrier-protein] synthase II
MTHNAVVVTGLGVVSPVGIGVDAFWRGLLEGRSGISEITSFDTSRHRVRIAGEVTGFDAEEWLDTKDARRLDRFCSFALAAAQMALDDAAFPHAYGRRVGTVFASGIGGAYSMQTAVAQCREQGPRRVSPLTVPRAIANTAAGKIAIRFGFTGPNTCPVTACAASADAVGWGFRLVRDGYADACLVGGSEACIVPPVIAGFANLHTLSEQNDDPPGACRPFDARRDGFVLAEGAGALLLERATDAHARGARIYARLVGYGQSCDAYHETCPDPSGRQLAQAITLALREGGLDAEDVDYINAHGTATEVNDPAETAAIKRALQSRAHHVPVSSTKSMTGHMLGAAGAVEAIVCAMAIHTGGIPPTINHQAPDPTCDLDCVPNQARAQEVAVALSNSMGFGGHNVCLAFCKEGHIHERERERDDYGEHEQDA